MSPNGTSSSSICCCSRYFRRSTTQQQPEQSNSQNTNLEPIEIKVNGQPHLMVPHVALRPSNSAPTVSTTQPINLAADTLSEINLELFETARTSRTNDSKLHPMRELIRIIRIEEGLEVTPRVETAVQPSTSSVIRNTHPMETIPEIPKHSKPRKAVFNDDGDISSRTNISHPKETVFSVTNTRRVSIESIDIPIITVPLSSSSAPSNQSRAMVRSSSISRRISSTPQMYASDEAWNQLNILKRRRVVRSASRYRMQYSPQINSDNYKNSPFPEPIASIDGSSVGSVNGEGERKKEKLMKSLKKLEKKKNEAETCLKDCQQKNQNCPAGPPGPPGKPGRDGDPGEPGVDGTNGPSGISVAVAGGCIKCPPGKPGTRGKKGKMGKKGKNGKNGRSVKAVVGIAGPIGDMGYPGYPGFPGERGPIGPPGRNTNRYISPPGPDGPPGREGYQGAQGPAGFIYNTGLVGPVGLSGRNGLNGRPGATGATGRMGRPGRDGNYCECPPMSKQNPFAVSI